MVGRQGYNHNVDADIIGKIESMMQSDDASSAELDYAVADIS